MPVYPWEGHPADVIGNAVKIKRIAPGEEEVNIPDDRKKSEAIISN